MLYKNNKIEDFTKINLYNEIKRMFVNQNKNVIFIIGNTSCKTVISKQIFTDLNFIPIFYNIFYKY